jgi:Cdc6-like AAA superfamily ATPase
MSIENEWFKLRPKFRNSIEILVTMGFKSKKRRSISDTTGSHQQLELSNRKSAHVINEDNNENLEAVLKAARDHGESNSLLLLGQRPDLEAILPSDTVFLNGILCANDNVAIKEIARQMSFTIGEEDEDESRKSFQDYFDLLVKRVNSPEKKGKRVKHAPIVVVLDEFHLFALQPKQRLLYALFDEVQASKNCLVVIGTTVRTVRFLISFGIDYRYIQ